MKRTTKDPHPFTTAAALGALAAFPTVNLLVAAGLIGGLSGEALGGLTIGTGAATTAAWPVTVRLRRRHARAAEPGHLV